MTSAARRARVRGGSGRPALIPPVGYLTRNANDVEAVFDLERTVIEPLTEVGFETFGALSVQVAVPAVSLPAQRFVDAPIFAEQRTAPAVIAWFVSTCRMGALTVTCAPDRAAAGVAVGRPIASG